MESMAATDKARREQAAEAARRVEEGTLTLGALLDRFLKTRAGELRWATVPATASV